MFIEDFTVKMHTNVGLHVFGAVVENFLCIQALGHRPRADDIIHNAFAKSFRHFMELHKLPYVVQHIVILGGSGRHLLDDCGDMTEDRGVQ